MITSILVQDNEYIINNDVNKKELLFPCANIKIGVLRSNIIYENI